MDGRRDRVVDAAAAPAADTISTNNFLTATNSFLKRKLVRRF